MHSSHQPLSTGAESAARGTVGAVGAVGPESDALMGVLAHELRTPITTIYAGSAVLARDEELLPAMRRELATDVYAEAGRLFRAVEDLLVLTRLEHDALLLTREPVSVIRSADAVARLEAGRFPGLHPMLNVDGAPPPAAADPQALAHVLRNLITSIGSRATGWVELDITVDLAEERVRCRIIDRTGSLTDADLPGFFALPEVDPGPGMISPGIAIYVAGALVRAMLGEAWASRGDDGAVELGFTLPRYEPA